MPSLIGVELARVGTWDLVTGKKTFTLEDLNDAVAASHDPDYGLPGIRPGHTDPRFDGEPALGKVDNLRVIGDRLVGDLVDLPDWLTRLRPDTGRPTIAAAYPERSIEGYSNVTSPSGRKYRLVLTSLALLGVTPPAMKGLADLPSAIAAGAELIAASSVAMGLAAEPIEAEASTSATPVAGAVNVSGERDASHKGAARMDHAAELRRVLGLAEDASDEDVTAAIAARPAPTADPPAPIEEPAPVAPVALVPPNGPPAAPAGVDVPPGFTLIADAVLDEIRDGAAQGIAAAQTLAKQAEDGFIKRHRPRIGPETNPHAKRTEEHLRREFARNPGEAEAFAASLAVRVPIAAAGHEDGGAEIDPAAEVAWTPAELAAFPELRTQGGN